MICFTFLRNVLSILREHGKENEMKKFISAMMIIILLAGSWNISVFAEDDRQMKPEEAVGQVSDKPPEVNAEEEGVQQMEAEISEGCDKFPEEDAGETCAASPEGNTAEPSDNQTKRILLDNNVAIELEADAGKNPGTEADKPLDEIAEEILNPENTPVFLAVNKAAAGQRTTTEKVTLRVGEQVNYGNWSTNYFYINDQLAYCLEPKKGTPSDGDYIAEVLNNDQLTKGMYYLMGGPGFTVDIREAFFSSAAGFTDKQIYAYCHAVLSFIYSGYNIDSDAFLGLNKEEKDGIVAISYQIRDSLPAPPDGTVSIAPNHQAAYWDEAAGHQRTGTYKVDGDARNVLSFTLPARVKLHNPVTGAVEGGSVSVRGGDSFWLEAEAGVNGRWESGKLKGSIQDTYMSFLIRSPGDDQDIGGLSYHREPLTTAEFSVEWAARGIIQIKKICSQTEKVLSGAEFEICARDEIIRNGMTLAKAGEIMAKVVTDSTGWGSTPMLPTDAYYIVRETKAPEGYVMSKEAAAGIEVYLAHDSAASGDGVPKVSMEIDNTVMDCDFTVHKVIKASDIVWANGNPTFLFRVTGEDIKGNAHAYARMVEFTQEYVKSNTDKNGNVRLSAVFRNIPCGRNYLVTEGDVNRYVLADVKSPDSNIKINRLQDSQYGRRPEKLFKITADLYEKPYGSSVTFNNNKIRWDDWSHNKTAVNCVR